MLLKTDDSLKVRLPRLSGTDLFRINDNSEVWVTLKTEKKNLVSTCGSHQT